MSRLPSVTGKQAISAFEHHGFTVARICGSHHMMKKPGHRFILTVPVHGRKPVKKGTLRKAIRDAGITISEFENSL